jgi:hypothetical protein
LAILAVPSILIAILFAEESNSALPNTNQQKSISVATYTPTQLAYNVSEGTITLANPTNTSFKNLNLTILLDGSNLLWYSNYTVQFTPNPQQKIFADLLNQTVSVNFSSPETPISIEPYPNETISIFFPSPESFEFSSHTLAIYVSQNTFGDIINGQALTIPQTKAYLQIKGYSPVENDQYTTYHGTSSTSEYVNDKPNFCQRYFPGSCNFSSREIYGMMARMNALGEIYFNVTVFNNNTFPVGSVMLFGGSSPIGPDALGRALFNYILQPNETYLFPVSLDSKAQYMLNGISSPSNGYATGDLINNQITFERTSSSPSPTVPEFSWLAIPPLLISTLAFALIHKYRRFLKQSV